MKRSRLGGWEWVAIILIVLVAWWARVWQPSELPPGWRDDELINIHTLTSEVLEGRPTIYFTGASGHEPLYHTLHAATVALVGMNPMGAHLLSIVGGVLTVVLSYVLMRRLFGRGVALVTALLLAPSFWSLMYSRFALRHAFLLPSVLAGFYFLWRGERGSRRGWVVGLFIAAALYTYTVSRVVPFILLVFGAYLFFFHRAKWRRWWRPLLIALVVAAVLTAPLWAAIARGRSEAAQMGIGADARISELAIPMREFLAGNPQPLIDNVVVTLGMFHATGDPEWLYNISGRPVFGIVGAVLFFVGLGLCVWRWRRPEFGFCLIWLAIGLSPTFVTLPPASLGHSILAQPVAMFLAALPLAEGAQWLSSKSDAGWLRRVSRLWRVVAALVIVAICAFSIVRRDLVDYFAVWPEQEMVRFLYRADYRQTVYWLEEHPQVEDVVVGSVLMGPWDRLALRDDLERDDVRVRLANPERVLFISTDGRSVFIETTFPTMDPALADLLGPALPVEQEGITARLLPTNLSQEDGEESIHFANGLALVGVTWPEEVSFSSEAATVWLTWQVDRPLDLPPIPIVANPPPPGAYTGPRLAVFAHLLAADGSLLVVDDGLWVDPVTLRPGDRFVQVHQFELPSGAPPGPYMLELGLYDPLTGDRWAVEEGGEWPDRVLVPTDGELP